MPSPDAELTVEEIRKLLPSGRMYELNLSSRYILAYDVNCMSHKEAIGLMRALEKIWVVGMVLVGFDGQVTQDPFHLYEVKEPTHA